MVIIHLSYIAFFAIAIGRSLIVEGSPGSRKISNENSLRYKNNIRERFRFSSNQDDGILGKIKRLRRSGTTRYITTRTMEPMIVRTIPENEEQDIPVTVTNGRTDEETDSHYDETKLHSGIITGSRRFYSRY